MLPPTISVRVASGGLPFPDLVGYQSFATTEFGTPLKLQVQCSPAGARSVDSSLSDEMD